MTDTTFPPVVSRDQFSAEVVEASVSLLISIRNSLVLNVIEIFRAAMDLAMRLASKILALTIAVVPSCMSCAHT